ncbi:MAG: P1 family peptidase [Pseudomonadota bacterium]
MLTAGPRNAITDVSGLTVGHATCEKTKSGVTVLRCAEPYVTAVDMRGGAPATRETDVFAAENLVSHAHAIVFSGGSVFGLSAADGVVNLLSAEDVGLRLSQSSPAIPIVPAAALHDLGNDGEKNWGEKSPYPDFGKRACANASEECAIGAVGAGRGAMAGARRGGIGSASIVLGDGVVVGALCAINPVGSVYMPDGETFYAWPWELGDEFGGRSAPATRDDAAPFPPHARLTYAAAHRENTTLAIVATSADLSSVEAKRVAIMAQDGIARAVRPAHTIFDGDIVFCVATAATPLPADAATPRPVSVAAIGSAAADCLARSIARGVYAAAH